MSKRNMIWLGGVVAVGAIGWLAFGILAGIVGAVLTLAASEVIERRVRSQRQAAGDTT